MAYSLESNTDHAMRVKVLDQPGCQEKQILIKRPLIILKVFVLQKSIKIFICLVMTAISYLAKLTLKVFHFLYITVFVYVQMLGQGEYFGLFNFVFVLFVFFPSFLNIFSFIYHAITL